MTPDYLQNMIQQNGISLLSFDIFDTLLTRPFEKPTDVFQYMAEHSPAVPDDFPQKRIHAERAARLSAPGRECRLDEIYAVLSKEEGYSDELCRLISSMEKETELRMCKVRPEGAALLDAASSWDIRVILISDMYLSKRRISRMLCKCGLKHFSELYVSCELRMSKATGNLYRYVRRKEELPFRTMLHVGDNPVSDVIIPRNLGMKALYLPMQEGAVLPAQSGVISTLFPHGTRRRNLLRTLKNL